MNNILELADALAEAIRRRGYSEDGAYTRDTLNAQAALKDLKAAIHNSSIDYTAMSKVVNTVKQSLARLNAPLR